MYFKKRKSMKNNLTEVVFILDRSGSMFGLEKDVVGGFNSTIKTQKENKGECLVSTVLFNDHSEVIHDRIPINKIDKMQETDYQLSGSTALIDALGDSINYIQKVHKIIRKEDVPTNTIFIITTDGQENSSNKYSSNEIKKLITKKQEQGWQFIYLASNIDAIETSKMYGFKKEYSHNCINDKRGNEVLFECVSGFMSATRAGGKTNKAFMNLNTDYNKRSRK